MVRRPRNILLKAEVNEASTATENVKHVDDKKRKAWSNKWFYKIPPLRQKIAVAIWPSAAEHG